MRNLFTALGFLTILPVPGQAGCTPERLSASARVFPLAGLFLGGLLALVTAGLWLLFPPLPAAVLAVLVLAGITGCLHLDGLADTADGFLSSRPRERVLEIMKDSRIGAMGVIAIGGALAAKMAALTVWGEVCPWRAVLLMALTSRCGMFLSMTILPSVTPGKGLGGLFCEKRSLPEAGWAAIVPLLAGWFASGAAGVIACAIGLVVAVTFSGYCLRRIGGATGDTLGATSELVEVAVALALIATPVRLLWNM